MLEQESECVFTNNEAIVSLQKKNLTREWPCLEMENLSKEQKRDFRNRILEKAQNVAENRAKSRSGKILTMNNFLIIKFLYVKR